MASKNRTIKIKKDTLSCIKVDFPDMTYDNAIRAYRNVFKQVLNGNKKIKIK